MNRTGLRGTVTAALFCLAALSQSHIAFAVEPVGHVVAGAADSVARHSQGDVGDPERPDPESPVPIEVPALPEGTPSTILPYAGKYEPRIGGWLLSRDDKLRLDIGTSVPLFERKREEGVFPGREGGPIRFVGYTLSAGVDFFTWTQLRSVGRFKFPVEAVDYYFGLYGAFQPQTDFEGFPLDVRLRLAHISAHLVDGDPRIAGGTNPEITYSREFIDLLTGQSRHMYRNSGRWYVGGVWSFSSIPSSIGRVVPYAGGDLSMELMQDVPLTFRLGYEFRLNTELETIGENLLRAGLKFAKLYDNGVVLELAYYAGRSPYGQFFDRREEYVSFGFSVDH